MEKVRDMPGVRNQAAAVQTLEEALNIRHKERKVKIPEAKETGLFKLKELVRNKPKLGGALISNKES